MKLKTRMDMHAACMARAPLSREARYTTTPLALLDCGCSCICSQPASLVGRHASRACAASSLAERAPTLLKDGLELPSLLERRQLVAAAYGLTVQDGVWYGGTTSELSENLLDVTVPLLAALVELDQREVDARREQRILAVGGVRSVGFAKDKQAPIAVRLDLLRDELALGRLRQRAQLRRQQLCRHRHGPIRRGKGCERGPEWSVTHRHTRPERVVP